jgi:predicted lysophospholipase L1 biosynthesis ABC-type transport system permease subunit
VRLSAFARYHHAVVAGTFDLFPTFRPDESTLGLAVVNGARLIEGAVAAQSDRAPVYNEAWFATDDRDATVEAVTALAARTIVDAETELLTQQEDPLVAAGWAGILAISFGAVLLLSAIGFIVYSYLSAQQRGLEFAILRTLGFSRIQVFTVVIVEQFFIIAAGMGLGTIVGLQVGRLMMDFLATDERGRDVLPPFALAVSWPEVFFVWGILGVVFVLTITTVVLLYLRLAVHRALRIGDA